MQSGLRFKEEGARTCSDVFMSDKDGNINIIGKNLMFTIFTAEDVNRHITELQTYAKTNKLHLSGGIVVARYDDGIDYKVIHISNTTAKEDDVDAKVQTAKTEKPKKKKTLTADEKLALIKDFYHEKGSFPKPNDVHKGFKIGTFWANLEKNKDTYDRIRRELAE